jgi:hypothetical protein
MENRNVSAQLYFKQLPEDTSAASYNCQNTYPNLSTCVNNVETDTSIENAFQDQLNLSEYYKSPEVFDTMKRDFMNKTMEYENEEKPIVNSSVYPEPPPVPTVVPVGPTDFLKKFLKEGFGSSGFGLWQIILIILAVLGGIGFFALNQH